jgi:5-methylcytosine-specific restriction protein B
MQDEELKELLTSHLTDSCYPDPELKTITSDLGYFILSYYKKSVEIGSDKWFPEHYSPNLTVDDWVDLLNDSEVFNSNSLEIMARMKDFGGMATCTQLSIKYGETFNFYRNGSIALTKRIAKKTGCPVMSVDTEDSKWWPILYVGKHADKDISGTYIWKLRDELNEALDIVDLSNVRLYAKDKDDESGCSYWWLNASPKIWSFANMAVGEIQSYTLYNDRGNKRRIFKNFTDAKVGDIIIGYEANPVKKIVAIAKVSQEQDGENLYFEKTEGLAVPIEYQNLKDCPELANMEFFVNSNGSLFKLTEDEYEFIMDMVRENNPVIIKPDSIEKYAKENFLSEVFMSEQKFDHLVELLTNKKNLILQGAPGVGKTFAAKRLAYAMIGEKNDSQVEFIQFHQNYSYEDFIMGYKPQDEGFKLTDGIFYQFCKKAANHPQQDFFFIIDEINRGNLSKVFGELLMLIEKDYRGTKATLAYSGTPFSVPENLYLIGMMNTADRSLAMIDYALRRRFSFFEMEPGFNSDGFKAYQDSLNNDTFNTLLDCINNLNRDIAIDSSLGKGFRIGHSYFCGREECTEDWMKSVVYYDIIPMLSEYWFDEPKKLQQWENILSGVFND